MASSSWQNAGAGFRMTGSCAGSMPITSMPSQAAPPNGRIPRSSHPTTQLCLRPLDKLPLITPRSSSTNARPSHRQSKLPLAPSSNRANKDSCRHPLVMSSLSSQLDRKGKGRAFDAACNHDQNVEFSRQPAKTRAGRLSSTVGPMPDPPYSTPSPPRSPSSAPRPTPVGHSMTKVSQPQRGPNLDFHSSFHADAAELVVESERRKRRRNETLAVVRRLDLCDEDLDENSAPPPERDMRRKHIKRSLDMDGDCEQLTEDVAAQSARLTSSSKGVRRMLIVRADSQPVDDSPSPTDSAFPSVGRRSRRPGRASRTLTLPSTSPGASDPEDDREPSTASSGSSAERVLQAQLVQPSKRTPRVLVPDSDPPSETEPDLLDVREEVVEKDDVGPADLDALFQRLSAKAGAGVDDSGFVDGELVTDAEDWDRTPSPIQSRNNVMDLTVVPSSSPLIAPMLLDAPRPKPAAPESSSSTPSSGSSLGRTASGILMPPPAVPRKRLRRGAPSTRAAAQGHARILVEDTQVRSPSRAQPPRPVQLPYDIVCGETQSQYDGLPSPISPVPVPHYRTLPRLPRPANLAGIGFLSSPSAGSSLSSDPEHFPPLPTPRPLAIPLATAETHTPVSFAQPCDHSDALLTGPDWSSIASAWQGMRPPSPSAPRQTHLNEFFPMRDVVPASQADVDSERDVVVEDSQLNPAGWASREAKEVERALEEALRRQKALNEVRDRVGTLVAARQRVRGDASMMPSPTWERQSEPAPFTLQKGDDMAKLAPFDMAAPPALEPVAEGLSLGNTPRLLSSSDVVDRHRTSGAEEVSDSDPEDDAPALSPLSPTTAANAAASASASTPRCARRPQPALFRSGVGPPSPLGTPVRKRFPRYSPAKMRQAVERWGHGPLGGTDAAPLEGRDAARNSLEGEAMRSSAEATNKDAAEDVNASQKGAGSADETQWESYWSYPASTATVVPSAIDSADAARFPMTDGRDDVGEQQNLDMDVDVDEDEEIVALPAGWARGAHGELVKTGTLVAARSGLGVVATQPAKALVMEDALLGR